MTIWTICGVTFWVACAVLLACFYRWSVMPDPWDQHSTRPYDLEDDADTLVLLSEYRRRDPVVPRVDPASFSFRYEQTDVEPGQQLRHWPGGTA